MTKDDSRIVKDPICGKEVDTLRARAVGIFGGVTYYFCSSDCKAQFKDPRNNPRAAAATAEAPRKKPEKPEKPAKILDRDRSGKFEKAEPSASFVVPKIEPPPEVKAQAKPAPKVMSRSELSRPKLTTPAKPTATTSTTGPERVVHFEAEPSSHYEQAEELTPIPTPRRRFPLLALLLLALLVAGGVVLFTLKHK